MKAGILAAGRGERLARAGIRVQKPLVSIGDEPLVARVIRAAGSVGISSASCIINDLGPDLSDYLHSNAWPLSLRVIKKTTANSLESFLCLAPYLEGEPFLLFTVDAVFGPAALRRFLMGVQVLRDARGVLALTRFVEDERPLWVDMGRDHRVRAVGDMVSPTPYVTAGFYYFQPDVLEFLQPARSGGLDSLRRFFAFLVDCGYPLFAVRVSKTIDVDDMKDIQMAEAYVRSRRGADP